jgi:putative ABC transport system ATP-binding protein
VTAVLELRDVVKRFRSGSELLTVVDGASLTVARGELVALYGPSGSGKTTLLHVAAGIVAPDSGSVRFEGRQVAGFSDAERVRYLRDEVGLVWQAFQLQPGLTALDNAATKLLARGMRPRPARALAFEFLQRVGLEHRASHLPRQLSTGERQRVAIARALANRPRLLLADEPTGNLDSARGHQVLQLLAAICADDGVAALLVTHDPEAAGYANRTLALRDGRVTPAHDPAPAGAGAADVARS